MMLSPRKIAGIVFDMDGTLLDSLPVQLESYRLAIVGSGGRDRSHAEILDSFGLGSASVMLERLIGRPVGAVASARYLAHLRDNAAGVAPYPGIAGALRDLSSSVPLGVFTAADTDAAEILLSVTGLRSSFDVVVGADLVARTKPAPDGLITACASLGVQPSETAYVGDGPFDMAAARACGAVGVAAGWGHQFALDREADMVVATPADLRRALLLPAG